LIVKEREIPIRLQKLEALFKRLPKNHPIRPQIEGELLKRWKGYKGEQSVDFYLNKLPQKEYMIFHNIRLKNGHYYFQIDTLILTPYFALILEVKNISGTLSFESTFNQMIQTTPNGENGYQNPIEQARQQCEELKKWLENRKILISIDFFVIISKPTTLLKADLTKSHLLQKLLHVQYLLNGIEKTKRIYQKQLINGKEMRKIARMILKEDTQETVDILNFYNLTGKDISKGVICSKCSTNPMIFHYGKWNCLNCEYRDPDAHYEAIADYFLLFNDTPISNKQFREFLQIPSSFTANRLLKSMKLPHTGTNKGRRYFSIDKNPRK